MSHDLPPRLKRALETYEREQGFQTADERESFIRALEAVNADMATEAERAAAAAVPMEWRQRAWGTLRRLFPDDLRYLHPPCDPR